MNYLNIKLNKYMVDIVREYTLPQINIKYFRDNCIIDISNAIIYIRYSLNVKRVYCNGYWINVNNFDNRKYYKHKSNIWDIR